MADKAIRMKPSLATALDLPTLQRALAGEARALSRLYLDCQPLVLRVARHVRLRLRLSDAPAELAAEVWLRLLDHGCRVLRAFDPTRGSFRGFLRMVAWQHALAIAQRWARRRRHEVSSVVGEHLEPPAPCALVAVHQRLLLERMLAAVPRLTDVDLALLEARHLGGTPMRELAPRLGQPVDVLYKRDHRLRARLRRAARRLESESLPAAA